MQMHWSYPERSSSLPSLDHLFSAPSLTCKYSGLVGRSSPEFIPHVQHTPSVVLPPTYPISPFPDQYTAPVPMITWGPQPSLLAGWLAGWSHTHPPGNPESLLQHMCWPGNPLYAQLGLGPSPRACQSRVLILPPCPPATWDPNT